jgi:NADPH:quinone reductase-like Zn-dependent oxidoreductase
VKAITQDAYGSADVLKLRDVPRPEPGEKQVLVRVHAAGLDPSVWHLMTGLPYMVRMMGFGFRAPKFHVCGTDAAGRVEAVGAGVSRFRVGDEVFGACRGSFAEYACASEDRLAARPANLTLAQAAAVPVSALTALQGLRDQGKVRAGQRVLIVGAGGGVGTFAVQLARAFGAEVSGVCSAAKVELVRSLGADQVIDYTREDFAETGQRWDVILVTAGNRPLSSLRHALVPRGVVVLGGGLGGGMWRGGMGGALGALALAPFVGQRLRFFIARGNREDLQLLKELIEAGKVTPVIDRTYPLADVAEALRHLEQGHTRGKIVITVEAPAG